MIEINHENVSKAQKLKWQNSKYRRHMSEIHKGQVPWNKGITGVASHSFGKIVSKETKRKLRESRLGKSLSEKAKKKISIANKGKTSWNKDKKNVYSEETIMKMQVAKKGRKVSYKTKLKMSNIHKERYKNNDKLRNAISRTSLKRWDEEWFRKKMTGENSHAWKGGIGREPYSFEFDNILKEKIRERDGYCCRKCGKSQKENRRKLDVHHINYDKKDCRPDNLISLCDSCNIKANYNRNNWQKFYEKIILEASL